MNSPETPAELRDLESRLSQLRPAAPPADLLRRLAAEAPDAAPQSQHKGEEFPALRVLPAEKPEPEQGRVVWLRVLPVAAAAAIACAAIVLWRPQTPPSPAVAVTNTAAPPAAASTPAEETAASPTPPPASPWTQGGFQPVSMQQQLRAADDRGVVELEKGAPVREIRLQIDETQQWEDPATRTEIRIIQPRQETLYIPVTPR